MSQDIGQGSELGVIAHDKPSACYFAASKQGKLTHVPCLLSYEVIAGLHLTLMRHHLNKWEILEIRYDRTNFWGAQGNKCWEKANWIWPLMIHRVKEERTSHISYSSVRLQKLPCVPLRNKQGLFAEFLFSLCFLLLSSVLFWRSRHEIIYPHTEQWKKYLNWLCTFIAIKHKNILISLCLLHSKLHFAC